MTELQRQRETIERSRGTLQGADDNISKVGWVGGGVGGETIERSRGTLKGADDNISTAGERGRGGEGRGEG